MGGEGQRHPSQRLKPPVLGTPWHWGGSGMLGRLQVQQKSQDVGDPPKAKPTNTPEMGFEPQILKMGVQKHF